MNITVSVAFPLVVRSGDVLLQTPSSGLHLVGHVEEIEEGGNVSARLATRVGGYTVGEHTSLEKACVAITRAVMVEGLKAVVR